MRPVSSDTGFFIGLERDWVFVEIKARSHAVEIIAIHFGNIDIYKVITFFQNTLLNISNRFRYSNRLKLIAGCES